MVVDPPDIRSLPLAPRNPLPYWQQLKALKTLHVGSEALRDAGGSVTRIWLGPKRLVPPMVMVTSPQGARDVLGRSGALSDRGTLPLLKDLRRAIGESVLNLPHDTWLPRRRTLQPIFTKQRVAGFAGHMSEAANHILLGWPDGAEVDLNAASHALVLRVVGHSVFGLDLQDKADVITTGVTLAAKWAADRSARPVRAPHWLPTPARRRARGAYDAMYKIAADMLAACRADPSREAPLIRALIDATDPNTGESLSDQQICDEMVYFMILGEDTTSTVLTYALWALGQHSQLQDRLAAEAAELGDRPLTPADVPRLGYTIQVLQEAMRLCPPGPTVFDAAQIDDSFYLPESAFKNPDFQRGLKMFLSKDGKAARFIIALDGDPATSAGISRVASIKQEAREAIKGTPLQSAAIYLGGTAATFKDISEGATFDLLIAGVAAISLIVIIMMLITRSVVAAAVIVGTVLLSMGSSFGLSVLVWEDILGIELYWMVLAMSVILLLAVGSDYNLLLISRLKEEIGAGLNTGIIRAMAGTGGVVTAAGMVFAVTMSLFVFSDLRIIGQIGTTIGLGLLFDTLIVRSFMTPSIAALLGRWFWWPQRVRPRPASQMLRPSGPRSLVRALLLSPENKSPEGHRLPEPGAPGTPNSSDVTVAGRAPIQPSGELPH